MSMIKTLTKTLGLVLTLGLIALAGCQRKDLLEPHDHYNLIVKANFDSLALSQLMSNKSDGYTKPGEPKTTSYILYEKTSNKVAYHGYFDGLGGGLYIEEGLYDLLLYTTDFNEYDANFFRGMDKLETAETHTRQTPLESVKDNDVKEMYVVEPDPTFSAFYEDILILHGAEDQYVDLEFVQKSFKYYLTIKCTGLHHIHTAKMNISGMYTTAFLSNEDHRMNESGTQTVDMQILRTKPTSQDDIGKGELYGEFWSFGPNQTESIVNSVTLYFMNGHVITKKLSDLTGQIKTLTRGGEIIVEEIIEIKGPPGGFQPGVEGWGDNEDIFMEL